MSASPGTALWFLCGTPAKASSRLQEYLIHEQFLRAGIDSRIVYAARDDRANDFPPLPTHLPRIGLGGSISIIQKLYGANTDHLIDYLHRCGSRVVYVNCDRRDANRSWHLADRVFATSTALCDDHARAADLPVDRIVDPYEYRIERRRSPVSPSPLRALWFGSRDNWECLRPWRRLIETEYAGRIELVTVSNHPEALIPWSFERQRAGLATADLGLVPTMTTPEARFKSSNRAVQILAAGLPCIAGPLEAHGELRAEGAPMRLVHDTPSLRHALDALLDSSVRRAEGEAALDWVRPRYSPEAVAQRWLAHLGLEGSPTTHPASLGAWRVPALRALLRGARPWQRVTL